MKQRVFRGRRKLINRVKKAIGVTLQEGPGPPRRVGEGKGFLSVAARRVRATIGRKEPSADRKGERMG